MVLNRLLSPFGDTLELMKQADYGKIVSIMAAPNFNVLATNSIAYYPIFSYTPATGKTFYFLYLSVQITQGSSTVQFNSIFTRNNGVNIEAFANTAFVSNQYETYNFRSLLPGSMIGDGVVTADIAVYSYSAVAGSSNIIGGISGLVI